MRCPVPGKGVWTVAGVCLLACLGDSLCYLPHPGLEPRGPEFSSLLNETAFQELKVFTEPQPGLPSWKVRQGYHQELRELEIKLGNLKRDASCAIAEAAVKARAAARQKARLQGSAAMHLALQFRDFMVYGWDPFTLQKMMVLKRAKLEKTQEHNGSVTDEVVCSSIMDSSIRSNEAWNAAAEEAEQAGASYVQETIILYLGVSVTLMSLAYAYQVAEGVRRGEMNEKEAKE